MKTVVRTSRLTITILCLLIGYARAQEVDDTFTNSIQMNFVLIEQSAKRKLWAQQDETSISQFAKFATDSVYTTRADNLVSIGALHPSESWRAWLAEPGEYPIMWVTFVDAVKFCEWLSKKEKREYRLPTEQEWKLLSSEQADEIEAHNDTIQERVNIQWELPLPMDKLNLIHQSLDSSLSDDDFELECSRVLMKPPRWFMLRRERKPLEHEKNIPAIVGKRIYQFHGATPNTILRHRDQRRVQIIGETWEVEIKFCHSSFLGFQAIGGTEFLVANKFDNSIAILGDTYRHPVAVYSLNGQLRWQSELHRVIGYNPRLEVEVYENGASLICFAADRESEELTIESFDTESGEVIFWWSSSFDLLSK